MTRIINIHTRSNFVRKTTPVSSDETIRSALEQAGIDVDGKDIALNGAIIGPDELDMTLDDWGVEGDDISVSALIRKDNAAR